MNGIRSLILAFSLYSKVPVPAVNWEEKNRKYVLCFLPAVGAVEGICVFALAKLLLIGGFGRLFFAAVLTVFPLLFTGGIHMDGFLDTVDALATWGDREKKLSVLKDSHVGAFAVMGAGVYLALSLGVWSELPCELLFLVSLGYVLSRGLSGLSAVTFPAARQEGMLNSLLTGIPVQVSRIVLVMWILAAGTGMFLWRPLEGTAMVLAALAIFLLYRRMCRRHFGGVTGDLAGYFLQVCELAMLAAGVLASHCVH